MTPAKKTNAAAVSRVLRAAGLGVVPDYSREGLRISRGVLGTVFVIAQADRDDAGWAIRAKADAASVLIAAGYDIQVLSGPMIQINGKRGRS